MFENVIMNPKTVNLKKNVKLETEEPQSMITSGKTTGVSKQHSVAMPGSVAMIKADLPRCYRRKDFKKIKIQKNIRVVTV